MTMNKRGGFFEMLGVVGMIVIFIIVAFVVVTIAAVWINGFGSIAGGLTSVDGTVGNDQNVSTYMETTFGNLNLGFQTFIWISVVIIFGMIIGIFAAGFMVRVHPAFFGVYLLFAAGAVVLSIFVSNSFNALTTTPGLGDTLDRFVAAAFVLNNLPVFVTAIALIGAIFMFIGISKDAEQGGLI